MSEWQPIDTAPDDEIILLYGGDVIDPRQGPIYPNMICIAWWTDEEMFRTEGGRFFVQRPTHWMPLPEPPETDNA